MIKAACQLTSECASVQALTGAACGPAIDVWSLGCVLAEVALQRPLFPATSAAELMQQVQRLLHTPKPYVIVLRMYCCLRGISCDSACLMCGPWDVLAEVALQWPLFPATSAAELMQQVQH